MDELGTFIRERDVKLVANYVSRWNVFI